MTTAGFIDLFATPIAGGVGGFLGMLFVAKDKGFTPKMAVGVGVVIAVVLFAYKLATR
ncbi:hypothetical protein [Stappia stellulata]|uniref:hypothetical protein n=1 Tax=Stappia stellulata TaxID=71235 RepID=UPI000424C783|nr:hypothetical protein [Stappia stellulata]